MNDQTTDDAKNVVPLSTASGQAAASATPLSGSVNFDAGLVQEVHAQKGQLDAQAVSGQADTIVSDDPSNDTGAGQATEAASAVNTMSVVPFITLDYSNSFMRSEEAAEYLKDLKSVTLSHTAGDESYNLYNPFARQKDNVKTGILRGCFTSILKLFATTANQKVIYLGMPKNAESMVASIGSSLIQSILNRLPARQNTVVCTIETESGPVPVLLRDVMSVKSWVASDKSDETGTVDLALNLNITINAAAFYASADPHKFVERATSFVANFVERFAEDYPDLEVALNPYICVAMDSQTLAEELPRTLLTTLVEDFGNLIVSRHGVRSGQESDWIPAGAESQLFPDSADMIFLAPTFPDVEEGEGEEEDPEGADEDSSEED
jgi:hypothetical protein